MDFLPATHYFTPSKVRIINFLLILFFPILIFPQDESFPKPENTVEISERISGDYLNLVDQTLWLTDPEGRLSFEKIHKKFNQFHPLSSLDTILSPSQVYWIVISLKNSTSVSKRWILRPGEQGYVDVYWKNGNEIIRSRTGKYTPEEFKDFPQSHLSSVRLDFSPGESRTIFIRLEEIDHAGIRPFLRLYSYTRWLELDQDPLDYTIIFFLGIFLIMSLYNLILYFTVRFRAYIFYALYLACVALFVLVAVGWFRTPPIGNPIYFYQAGYLAFGAINIFYFQFGRSLLDTRNNFPRLDKWLLRYIQFKIILLSILQAIIFFTFNLTDVLMVEFGMLFLDVGISLLLFVILMKKPNPATRYFVSGSSAVILGLCAASIGHIMNWESSFEIFLSTIVFEIICFSLALGYRIRQSEKEKLAAQEEKLIAQERLNRELSKVNTAFGRFVPHEFLKSLGKESVLDVSLGDSVEKEVNVLFSDIRGYTTLSESMTPEENFQFLNTYLGKVGPVIKKYNGFVNQYYGDGIMALFLDKAEDAVIAAIEMHKAIRTFNLEREKSSLPSISLGIGIHSGPLMMGVIGDTLRMDTGVVSDTVNTASRMEGLTKHFHASTLISDSTFVNIPYKTSLSHRFLGKVKVKGKKEAVGVYEFFGGDVEFIKNLKLQTAPLFREALDAYFKQNFSEAATIFDKLLTLFPEDETAQHYKTLTLENLLNGVPGDWSGIELMDKK